MDSAPKRILDKLKSVFTKGLFGRIAKNVAMLTSGKGAAAIISLACIALATNTLGVHQFGVLILIHTYVIVFREFTSFRTSQCLIRYGAVCLKDNNKDDFQSLMKFTFLLDVFSAVFGAVIAALLMPVVGHLFGLTADIIPMATAYCFVILLNFKSAAVGALRLFNRFDLVAKQMLVTPLIRLTGAALAFLADADVKVFLVIWFLGGMGNTIACMWFGLAELNRQGFLKGLNWQLRGLTRPHANIWSFVWTANIHMTLNQTLTHMSTLAVGFVLGPSGAGLFKIAQEASSVLVKPAQLFNDTLYPELAKLATGSDRSKLWRVIIRAGLIATGIAGTLILIIVLLGKPLLASIFGADFVGSYTVLILLMVAGAILLASFAFDPALYAVGRPDISMRVKLLTSILHILLTLYLLIFMNLPGAGVAAIISSMTTALLLFSHSRRILKSLE